MFGLRTPKISRKRAAILAVAVLMLVALFGSVHNSQALASPVADSPGANSFCTYNGSPSQVSGASLTGISPVSVVCQNLTPNTDFDVVQGSPLAANSSPKSATTHEVDKQTKVTMKTDGSGDGSAVIDVTATGGTPSFSATDPNAVCPPSQAQVNAGLTNCAVAVGHLVLDFGFEAYNFASIEYTSQPNPNPPSLLTTPGSATAGTAGTNVTITASDAAGACPTPSTATSQCWWGGSFPGAPNSVWGIPGFTTVLRAYNADGSHTDLSATNTLSASMPFYCQSGGAQSALCTGVPAGTVIPPMLSGTITTPGSGLRGFNQVVADEPNIVGMGGNGTLPPIIPGTTNVEATSNFIVPVAITTIGLPNGAVDSTYTATLTAIGGTIPYAWSISAGSLPPGLSLGSSTGAISGTPTTAGTTTFTVTATDSTPASVTPPGVAVPVTTGGPFTSSQNLSIMVCPAALTITTASLPDAQIGKAYSATLTATGGTQPYTWSISAGSLPPGLSLDPATGVISGEPITPRGQGRVFNFTVTAGDSSPASLCGPQAAAQNLSISLVPNT